MKFVEEGSRQVLSNRHGVATHVDPPTYQACLLACGSRQSSGTVITVSNEKAILKDEDLKPGHVHVQNQVSLSELRLTRPFSGVGAYH